MGKDFKGACRNVVGYIKSDKKSLRRLMLSLISLIVASVVLVTMTFSWFSVKTSNLEATNFRLDCGKGLRVNDTGTSRLSFSQVDGYLIPASSVDGRNLYFPADGSDFSNVTEQMTFRSANVGDKNVNYIQIDFSLTAQQNHTALYINEEKTSIKVQSEGEQSWSIPQAAALRSALWSSTAEGGIPNTPIVFNPTASTVRTAAVEDVDRSTGAYISSGRQVAHAFSEYAFGGEPVATLSKGVETKFSYIIWLEGTDPKCTDKIMNKKVQINLSFTTSWDKTQTIRFEDRTGEALADKKIKALMDNHYTLTLRYEDPNRASDYTDFSMYPYRTDSGNYTWSCNIPGDMTNKIYFILRPTSASNGDNLLTYQFTKDTSGASTYNRGANRLYVADTLNTTTPADSRGHWIAVGDSDGAGSDDGGNVDGDDF